MHYLVREDVEEDEENAEEHHCQQAKNDLTAFLQLSLAYLLAPVLMLLDLRGHSVLMIANALSVLVHRC